MAVYKTKSFARWAKNAGLQDAELLEAALDVADGRVEAKLGGGIFKKRVALPGNRGKSGGSRTLIACKRGEHSFFLFGFEKNERGNISPKELKVLKESAIVWWSLGDKELVRAVRAGSLAVVGS